MKNKKILIRNVVILVFSLLFLLGGGMCVYADQLLGKIHYAAPESGESQAKTGALFGTAAASSGTVSAKAGLVGGLCHDDAVNNILLLGVDDYQKNDVGRSDSMMLVSVDSRHQKLKVTSFMRDMYLAIPGHGSNKLTTAYSYGCNASGPAQGARMLVTTVEANFGVDIDRFVIVDFSAFPKIIDRLGGVDITLTDETNADGITEAGLINAYSGETGRPVHTGKNTLTGKQARYYSRIRDIGNDFERTLRQRKVFSAAVAKLKTSNLATINAVLADTLPLVTTNMTKNEVLAMAANSMTYLNYPISEHRVPQDGQYENITNDAGKCLGIDLAKCKQSFLSFLYEKDIPTGSYS